MNSPLFLRTRFIVYCPRMYRNRRPIFGHGPLLAMAEHSRPVYRVLDRAYLAIGNNPEAPLHRTARPVADGLDYLAAMRKADDLTRQAVLDEAFAPNL